MVAQGEKWLPSYNQIERIVAGRDPIARRELGHVRRVALRLSRRDLDVSAATMIGQTIPARFRVFEETIGGTVLDAVLTAVRDERVTRFAPRAEIFVPSGTSGEGYTIWRAADPEIPPNKRDRETREQKKAIIRSYLLSGDASRKTIAADTGLHPSTVTRATAEMLSAGEITEGNVLPGNKRRGGGHERKLTLVEDETTREPELGHILTQWGNDERKALDEIASGAKGDHIALLGHLLYFSYLYPSLTLREVFGKSNIKGKTTAPQTRSRMFRILSGRDELGEGELLKELSDKYPQDYSRKSLSTISNHLLNLSKVGLLSYETRSLGTSVVSYTSSDKKKPLEIPDDQLLKSYIRDMYTILHFNPGIPMSRSDFARIYLEMHPDKTMSDRLLVRISNALNFLARHGHAMRGQLSADKRTNITMSNDDGGQREKIEILAALLTLYLVRDPKSLQIGQERAEMFMVNPVLEKALRAKATKRYQIPKA